MGDLSGSAGSSTPLPVQQPPFIDLGRRPAAERQLLAEAVQRVLDSGRFLDGPELAAFEHEWAAYTGSAFAVGVGSGTDALRLTLVALGVGAGDEVIIPAFTAIPTIAAVCAAGATPVPVDVDDRTAALDLDAAAAAVTPRTRAIIVVHLYGRPVPLPELGLPVIEDAAHAHGALRGVGGVAVAYSFYPTKNLGGIGDGGAVLTDDAGLAERVRRLRSHGREGELHTEISTNSRLSELGAAALRIGLVSLDSGNARRREIAAAYRAAAPDLGWQREHPDHVHHLCVARIEDRDGFRAAAPFGTGVHYPLAVTDEPAYSGFAREPVPRAQAWAGECVSLPCYPGLSDQELEWICAHLS
jgi:dTDP-3-amino-3,4,6-trideoxy-alpha-D-glucose transaminase